MTDLEPLYWDMLAVIRKVVHLDDRVACLRDPVTGKLIGYDKTCFVKDSAGDLIAWTDGMPAPSEIFDARGHQIFTGVGRTALQDYVKNIAVFNIAGCVYDRIIEHAVAYTTKGRAIYFHDAFKELINPQNMRYNEEQLRYFEERAKLRAQVAQDHVEQMKRDMIVKFEMMTIGQEADFIRQEMQRYDDETALLVFRDDVTQEAIDIMGDELFEVIKRSPDFWSFRDMIVQNHWGIYSTRIARRATQPFNLQVLFHGDLRVAQWEKEHLHEYPNLEPY